MNKQKLDKVLNTIKALYAIQHMKTDGVPAEVLPGLYIGSIGAALNKKNLHEAKITHILCCCDNIKSSFPNVSKHNEYNLEI